MYRGFVIQVEKEKYNTTYLEKEDYNIYRFSGNIKGFVSSHWSSTGLLKSDLELKVKETIDKHKGV